MALLSRAEASEPLRDMVPDLASSVGVGSTFNISSALTAAVKKKKRMTLFILLLLVDVH